ncbi:MAG: hypothetical protein ACJ77N_01610 [Chloroflexota bacterium]|jgi:hypothetical protein
MAMSRNDLLGELASDAALERTDFIVQATEQLHKFLEANRNRIADVGGLTLIDEDPEYLAVAPDLSFRSRSRFEDPDTGEWVSETEVIENASELIELYNPAEIYSAFAEAAREAAGLREQPTAADELMDVAGVPPEGTFPAEEGAGAYAGAADTWAAAQPAVDDADTEEGAARRLYDLALEFQERSQRSEARLLEQFEDSAGRLSERLGDLIIVDDEDERLLLASDGHFRAEVQPEDAEGEWRGLQDPDELVEYYDPTDVFGDLADALAEAFPAIVPEAGAAGGDGDEAPAEATPEGALDIDEELGSNGSRP